MTNDDIPPLLDNPHAPDVYADRWSGFHYLNGNMRITFETARVSHVSDPGPTNRVVIGRLIIPPGYGRDPGPRNIELCSEGPC